MKNTPIILLALSVLFSACNPGYQKEGGQWSWVSYNENVGKKVDYIESIDNESFQVLSNADYGKDKNNVYYQGRIIKGSDPNTFEVINKDGYSKDKNSVFITNYALIAANPNSFQYLKFPYSKDEHHVFCGILPLQGLDKTEVAEFKVTNTDELMANMRSTTMLSHFIEFNPEYAWLDTIGIDAVLLGEWGTGETARRKFKGVKELE